MTPGDNWPKSGDDEDEEEARAVNRLNNCCFESSSDSSIKDFFLLFCSRILLLRLQLMAVVADVGRAAMRCVGLQLAGYTCNTKVGRVC